VDYYIPQWHYENRLSNVTYNQIPKGIYSITGITWNGIYVLPTIPSNITLAHIYTVVWTPSINCILPPSLSISLGSSSSLIGFKVDVKGNLTCNEFGIAGAPILMSYRVNNGQTWNDITQINTALSGSYSATWIPSATDTSW